MKNILVLAALLAVVAAQNTTTDRVTITTDGITNTTDGNTSITARNTNTTDDDRPTSTARTTSEPRPMTVFKINDTSPTIIVDDDTSPTSPKTTDGIANATDSSVDKDGYAIVIHIKDPYLFFRILRLLDQPRPPPFYRWRFPFASDYEWKRRRRSVR